MSIKSSSCPTAHCDLRPAFSFVGFSPVGKGCNSSSHESSESLSEFVDMVLSNREVI